MGEEKQEHEKPWNATVCPKGIWVEVLRTVLAFDKYLMNKWMEYEKKLKQYILLWWI